VDTILGLLGFVVWIAVVIALAAAVTWVVVKVSPGDRGEDASSTPKSGA
jgi:hypothetical protein